MMFEGEDRAESDSGDNLAEKLNQLGPPQAEFVVSISEILWLLLTSVVLLPLGLTAIVAALLSDKVGHHALVIGAAFIIVSISTAFRAFKRWGLRVLIYPEGLVHHRHYQVSAIFWHEVEVVWEKRHQWANDYWKEARVYVIRRKNGEVFQFDDALPQISRLGYILQQRTLAHLLPPVLQAFQAGETLVYHRLGFSRDGVKQGSEIVPWEQVELIQFENTELTIMKRGNRKVWFQATTCDTPNVHVLRALLCEFVRHKVVFK